jgi:hypothetical protein
MIVEEEIYQVSRVIYHLQQPGTGITGISFAPKKEVALACQ